MDSTTSLVADKATREESAPLAAYGDPPLTPDEAYAAGLEAGLEGRFSRAPLGYTHRLAAAWSRGYEAGAEERWADYADWQYAVDVLNGDVPEQEVRGWATGGHRAWEV
jgi:hypothetical protein